MFVVDDLLGWLVGRLADAGYEKFKTRFWGSDQERALRQAVVAAVQDTADEVQSSGGEWTEQFAKTLNEIFRRPMPDGLPTGQGTLLEALQKGIEGRLTALPDAGLTGGSRAAADVLGVPGTTVAEKLTSCLVREILVRGSNPGPLTPLASQLNDDLTHLQGQRIEGMIALLIDEVRAALARPGTDLPEIPGRPLAEMIDPFALEVQRAIQPEDPQPGLPELPAYVPREHDTRLARVVQAAAEGRSGIAVLVGGSSTGKTRACWEALQLLRDRSEEWRLWHPIDPSRTEAALRELPAIGPRTVVWLNDAQLYLDDADGGPGERVAAGLRELLRDPARAPVLVLGTLWQLSWGGLTARPADGTDPHAQARELLAGHDIAVPDAFSPAELQRLHEARDSRLAQAAAWAQDGQVIQFLAGAVELLARYRNAPPAAVALIHAAMDARRLGMGELPQAFLEAAAPPVSGSGSGYLTEWDTLGEDWLEQALAYTAVDCNGVRGPLTRFRPPPARSRATGAGSQGGNEQLAGNLSGIPGMPDRPLYRLADYLDQYGRQHRDGQYPPAGFWAAAADHAFPADQAALGDAAHTRGLYRDAAQLRKNAAACGSLRAALRLAIPPDYLRTDARPSRWAITYMPLDDPYAVAQLLYGLRAAGSAEQVTALAERAAASFPLDDPGAVHRLLNSLLAAGAQEQVIALLNRNPAANVSLDDPNGVTWLLDVLREAGADAAEQLTVLAERAAAYFSLYDPDLVATLLGRLTEAGTEEQVITLLNRNPAANVSLDHVYGPRHNAPGVAKLLRRLWEAGATEQASVLADRVLGYVPFNDPSTLVTLLDAMREVGAAEQASALAARVAARGSFDDPFGVAWLLRWLLKAGAAEQATAMVERVAAQIPLNFTNSSAVTALLGSMREAGAAEQASALAARAAARVSVDNPDAVATLLDGLCGAGAAEQVTVLADRAAARVSLDDPGSVARLLDSLQAASAQEQVTVIAERAVTRVSLDNPGGVARLLDSLQAAGAQEQVAALLNRGPADRVSLDNPGAVAMLLSRLSQAGAAEQVTVLADRAAAHVALDGPYTVTTLLDGLREAGAAEQVTVLADRAAAHVSLDGPGSVALLLNRLRAAGAEQQATVLVGRLPAAGHFELFRKQDDYQYRFAFGRKPDGSPADPWGWGDLD